jgi:hypothetical protein
MRRCLPRWLRRSADHGHGPLAAALRHRLHRRSLRRADGADGSHRRLAGGIYALADVTDSGRRYGFFPLLLMLMAGVTGAFLTGDVFNLYVWFEVLLISSFGLLILGSEREQIDGALKYAVLNLIGTTLFLIAVGILYAVFGTLNMADIATKVEGVRGWRAADDAGGALPARLCHEGCRVSGQFLAARLLSYAAHRRLGALCRPADQGRRLCADPRHGHASAGGARAAEPADRSRRGGYHRLSAHSALWRRTISAGCSAMSSSRGSATC